MPGGRPAAARSRRTVRSLEGRAEVRALDGRRRRHHEADDQPVPAPEDPSAFILDAGLLVLGFRTATPAASSFQTFFLTG